MLIHTVLFTALIAGAAVAFSGGAGSGWGGRNDFVSSASRMGGGGGWGGNWGGEREHRGHHDDD